MAPQPPGSEKTPTKLTPQERRLVECAARGEWWVPELADGEKPDVDPANAGNWPENRTLRAEILCALATDDTWPGEKKP